MKTNYFDLEKYLENKSEYCEANNMLYNVLLSQSKIHAQNFYDVNDDEDDEILDGIRLNEDYMYCIIFNATYHILQQMKKHKCPQLKISEYIDVAKTKIETAANYPDATSWTEYCSYFVLGMVDILSDLMFFNEQMKMYKFHKAVSSYRKRDESVDTVLQLFDNLSESPEWKELRQKNERKITNKNSTSPIIKDECNLKDDSDTAILERQDQLQKIKSKRITAREVANIVNKSGYTKGMTKPHMMKMLSLITGISASSFKNALYKSLDYQLEDL